jgi:hypothetical protein
MREKREYHPKYYTLRSQLKEAFKKLRNKKLYARMNFLCCGSCATYDLECKLKTSNTKLGYVFWHSQDEERFKNSGFVWLGYGGISEDKVLKVGQIIVDTLSELNIPHEWSGDSNERIRVG